MSDFALVFFPFYSRGSAAEGLDENMKRRHNGKKKKKIGEQAERSLEMVSYDSAVVVKLN